MTPRPLAWMRRVALGLAVVATTIALSGCDPRQALYFFQPFDPTIPGECPSLKGKRVVILTRSAPGLQSDFLTVDREVTEKLVKIMKEKIKKIDIVNTEKVREWLKSKPSLSDPAEAARAFDADIVVSLEIQQFEIQSPIAVDMYHGKANIHIQVTELNYPKDDDGKRLKDKEKESEVVYDGDVTTEFPTTGGVPIESGTSKSDFKNRFLKIAVEELSWKFTEHAPGDNIQDTKFKE